MLSSIETTATFSASAASPGAGGAQTGGQSPATDAGRDAGVSAAHTLRSVFSALNDKLAGIYLIVLFFISWQVVPTLGLVNTLYFPALSTVLSAGINDIGVSAILSDLGNSLRRVVIGYGLAIVAALPVGFILAGALPKLAQFLKPLMSFLSQIPPFILLPVFVLLFKVGEFSICAVIFWSAFWPILFATILGISLVDPLLIKAARSMAADKVTIFTDVIIPGALPSIMTGLRYGLTFTFMMLIAAESLGSFAGLGYEMMVAQRRAQIPKIYFMVLLIAIVGIIANYLLELLERKAVIWNRDATEKVA
ncbi:MAG: ABC transporter permease [Coriobacteriales bacterium]|nr:ABC transporter permease [Coriobacteriales bacterium]